MKKIIYLINKILFFILLIIIISYKSKTNFLTIFINFVYAKEYNNQQPKTSSQSLRFFNFDSQNQLNNSQSSTSQFSNSSSTNQKLSINNQSLTYFAQCDSPYASLPMAEGCTVCNTGCGPTTVAMIASSYVNKSYDPKKIIEMYKEKGYYLSCSGTRYTDAKALLQSLGLKTTDYIVFDLETADKVIDDLKKYYESGWTFMALANFKDEGPGHFFWITEIDSKGNLWAYDVYYGRFEAPPINENSRYPFPKYRVIFGVKK